jgi:hypothetical protein
MKQSDRNIKWGLSGRNHLKGRGQKDSVMGDEYDQCSLQACMKIE